MLSRIVRACRSIKNSERCAIVCAQWATRKFSLWKVWRKEPRLYELTRLHGLLQIMTARRIPNPQLMPQTRFSRRLAALGTSTDEQKNDCREPMNVASCGHGGEVDRGAKLDIEKQGEAGIEEVVPIEEQTGRPAFENIAFQIEGATQVGGDETFGAFVEHRFVQPSERIGRGAGGIGESDQQQEDAFDTSWQLGLFKFFDSAYRVRHESTCSHPIDAVRRKSLGGGALLSSLCDGLSGRVPEFGELPEIRAGPKGRCEASETGGAAEFCEAHHFGNGDDPLRADRDAAEPGGIRRRGHERVIGPLDCSAGFSSGDLGSDHPEFQEADQSGDVGGGDDPVFG